MALSGRAATADLPLSLPPPPASRRPRGRIEAASQRTRIALICAVRAVGNWRGAVGETRTNREGAPGDVWPCCSVLPMMILEGMNRLDELSMSPTIRSHSVPQLSRRPKESICSELSARPGLEANSFPALRRVNLFPYDSVLVRCFTLQGLKFSPVAWVEFNREFGMSIIQLGDDDSERNEYMR
jgi:hypothetical protein